MADVIEIIRWIIGVPAILLGGLIALGNWVTFTGIIITKKGASFVPLVGGALAIIGMLVIPIEGMLRWAWTPLFLDFGTVPWAVWSVIGGVLYRRRGDGESEG